jgi:hypothetical protein
MEKINTTHVKITFDNDTNIRQLIVNNETTIDISNDKTVKYTAIYYPNAEDFIRNQIITEFIGTIWGHKWHYQYGYLGVYIEPTYIFIDNQWKKIINYIRPNKKYFVYPHFLIDPSINYHHSHGLEFLHTIEPVSHTNIEEITQYDITETCLTNN